MKKLDIKLYKMEVIPGKEAVAHEWLEFLKTHKEAAAETLKNEKVYLESYFEAQEEGTMFIYCFMAAQDIEYAMKVARGSGNKLDKQHFEFATACISQISGDIMDAVFYVENM